MITTVKLINMLSHIVTTVCMGGGTFHFSENNFLKKEVTFNFNQRVTKGLDLRKEALCN